MILHRRCEAPLVWHRFEQILEKMEESFAHGVAVFGLKIVDVCLVLIRKSRFTTAESEVYLQILSQKLLGKELIVTAFMTVRRGEGDILMVVLPVNLVAVHLHFIDKIFLAAGVVGNVICLATKHLLPLWHGLEGGFRFGFGEPVLPTELVRTLFYLNQLGSALMKFLSRFHVHRVENDMIVDVVGVSVRGNQRLIATEVFSEAQTDLVCRFGRNIIVRAEGLYDVNVGPAVLFFELFFDKSELLKHRIGGAVDA